MLGKTPVCWLHHVLRASSLQVQEDLQAAGHPDFQTSGDFVEIGPSIQPAVLNVRRAELRTCLEGWQSQSATVLHEEARLRLLKPLPRLAAVIACKEWLEGRTHAVTGSFCGSWSESTEDVTALPFNGAGSESGVYVFASVCGSRAIMALYRLSPDADPYRIEGRATSLNALIDAATISEAWDNAEQRNVGSEEVSVSGISITGSGLASALEPYAFQMFPETTSKRSAASEALANVCQAMVYRISDTSAVWLLVAVVQALPAELAALIPELRGITVGPREADEFNGEVHAVDASSECAAAALDPCHVGRTDPVYDAALKLVGGLCAPAGVSPAQLLFCSKETSEQEVSEWAELTLVPKLVSCCAALHVDGLRPR